jgi:hypothetical protein
MLVTRKRVPVIPKYFICRNEKKNLGNSRAKFAKLNVVTPISKLSAASITFIPAITLYVTAIADEIDKSINKFKNIVNERDLFFASVIMLSIGKNNRIKFSLLVKKEITINKIINQNEIFL